MKVKTEVEVDGTKQRRLRLFRCTSRHSSPPVGPAVPFGPAEAPAHVPRALRGPVAHRGLVALALALALAFSNPDALLPEPQSESESESEPAGALDAQRERERSQVLVARVPVRSPAEFAEAAAGEFSA